MENWLVLLKAGIALVWVCSLVYLPMKWWANRFWPTPAVPIDLSGDPPFWSRAAWRIFQFCTFIGVAWLFTYGGADSLNPLIVGLFAASTTYFATVLASGVLGAFNRASALRSFPLKALLAPSTPSQGLSWIGALRERGRLRGRFRRIAG
jgi:hypothetical protein